MTETLQSQPDATAVESQDRVYLGLLVAYLLASALLFYLVSEYTERREKKALENRAANTSAVYTANLASEIARYQEIPQLLARNPILEKALSQPGNPEALDTVNRELEKANKILDTMDVYLLNADGVTIASSNWNTEQSFIGEDLRFRPYFSDAATTGSGQYFALGTTSKKRGHYFSSRINATGDNAGERLSATPGDSGKNTLGVIVIKADLANIETAWAAGNEKVTVTDEDGVFFFSSDPDWLYRSLTPLSQENLDKIAADRRFPGIVPSPLNANIITTKTVERGGEQLEVSVGAGTDSGTKGTQEFLIVSSILKNQNWKLQLWSDLNTIKPVVSKAQTITVLCLIALLLLTTLVLNKLRERQRQRGMELASHNQLQNAYGELEQRVMERTEALSLTNQRLQAEITERKQAENDLHRAQDNLVHAGKMAAVGQMATSITHELSQPLGAVQTFTDNATTYLERNQYKEVATNLEIIGGMVDRMKDIMRHLKSFSRKTPLSLEAVNLQHVIDETLIVMHRQLGDIDLEVITDKNLQDVRVMAEAVRLQQVLTNLISNAVRVLENQSRKIIKIEITPDVSESGFIQVTVSDSGPGIDKDMADKLFEPFQSADTSGDGLGLGLAISHSIMREFNGSISASRASLGGACFTLSLEQASEEAGDKPQGETTVGIAKPTKALNAQGLARSPNKTTEVPPTLQRNDAVVAASEKANG